MDETMVLRMKRLRPQAQLPQRQTAGSAGYDLCACVQEPVVLEPGDSFAFPTGLAAEIPACCVGLVFTRSSMGVKHGITLPNSVGVIDSDYTGEVCVGLINQFDEPYEIQPGERIAQLAVLPILCPVIEAVDTLTQTQRGEGGFGSTGR